MRTRKLRLLSAFLALAMLLTLLPTAAFADEDTTPATDTTADGDWTYYVNDDDNNTVTIHKYNGSGTVVEIPGIIDGKTVTDIGKWAFLGLDNLTKVTIPDSVKSIGYAAFGGCQKLENFDFPSSLKNIGDYAFIHCEGLTSVRIPSGVTTIGEYAFHECITLENVKLSSSLESIGEAAFGGCALNSITIPRSVKSIAEHAFNGCIKLNRVNFDGSKSEWENLRHNIAINNGILNSNDVNYRHDVDFDPNGGKINEKDTVATKIIYSRGTINLMGAECYDSDDIEHMKKFAAPTPTREGYTFKGWYIKDADGNLSNEKFNFDNATITEDMGNITLYAKWTLNSYNVILDGEEDNAEEYGYDTAVTIDAPAADSKPGHTFTGWEVVEPKGLEATTDEKDKSLSFKMPASDVKLEAQWDLNTYTVTFVNDKGKTEEEKEFTQPVKYGKLVEEPADPKTEGYIFAYWYLGNDDTKAYDFGQKVENSFTLYAKWTPKYELKASYFDFDAKDPTHVTFEPLVDGVGEITIKYYENDKLVTDENGKPIAPTEPGTYTVKIDVTEGDTYLAGADLTEKDWTFTIAKKPDPKPVTYTVTVENGTAYDGETPKNNFKQGETVTIKVNEEALKEMDFDKWEVVKGDAKLADETAKETTFDMPAEDVELKAVLKAKAPEEPKEMKPHPASVAVGAGVAVVGGAVLGYTGYLMAREMFATAILPAGAALPTNKAELAVLLWKQADQPQPETETAFADIEDADTQSAAQWAVANGLMSAEADGTFAPEKSVSLMEVYQALKAEKANK